MDLLASPTVSETLGTIRARFGVDATRDSALDRFFWLHAARSADDRGALSIWPAHERPQAGPPGEAGSDGAPVRLCNIVLQGGGTLGLAHAGFVAGLEAAGIRFVGLAGTSAGSIMAMGIAAIRGDDLTRKTYRELVRITDAVPMDSFIDGPRPVRVLIKRALKGHRVYLPQFWPGLIAVLRRLRDRRGLNHGTAFETWFESVMTELGWARIDDLYAALDRIWHDLSDLRALRADDGNGDPVLRDPSRVDPSLEARPGVVLLQLISMAMPVGLKFRLPQDLHYLAAEYERISPARLVRTSMSIPAFFEPVVMRTNPKTWAERVRNEVSDLVSRHEARGFGELEELMFLDGGMMSNLPSDSFRDLMPDVPTVVVPLVHGGTPRNITRRNRLADLGLDAAACATAVRLQRDRETWAQNTALRAAFDKAEDAAPGVLARTRPRRRYPVAIAPIDTGDANWLNFVMSAREKADLFETGLIRAHDLLEQIETGATR